MDWTNSIALFAQQVNKPKGEKGDAARFDPDIIWIIVAASGGSTPTPSASAGPTSCTWYNDYASASPEASASPGASATSLSN